jgi:uncharacterized protein (DUF362 family)
VKEILAMATVVITQNKAIEEAVGEALRHLSLEPLLRGKRVAVKPNETYATLDDKTGVTQPDTLRAVLGHEILVNEQEHQIDLATALGKDVTELTTPQERA